MLILLHRHHAPTQCAVVHSEFKETRKVQGGYHLGAAEESFLPWSVLKSYWILGSSTGSSALCIGQKRGINLIRIS